MASACHSLPATQGGHALGEVCVSLLGRLFRAAAATGVGGEVHEVKYRSWRQHPLAFVRWPCGPEVTIFVAARRPSPHCSCSSEQRHSIDYDCCSVGTRVEVVCCGFAFGPTCCGVP